MGIGFIIFTAVVPALVLLFYIWKKDKYNQEPPMQLIKAFLYGVCATWVSLGISMPLRAMGFFTDAPATWLDEVRVALFGAGLPEETAKLLMLWLVVRRNKYFDERMDGVVYAAAVSLGFAALENVMYVTSNLDHFFYVSISRALLAIPGHFFFGVLMGYYYSLAHFEGGENKRLYQILTLAAPVAAHTAFDAVLMVMEVAPALSYVLFAVFFVLVHLLYKRSSKHIADLLARDEWQKGREVFRV
jgi:RsiW-degrading membrane proteinase PrsW (M82 family)